jgi:hypothetical protein
MSDKSKALLEQADEILAMVNGLDTAVRDNVAVGVSYIVHAANDCAALNLDLSVDQWMSYIEKATADWFRARGFAEWFCAGAATGFRTSRPRELVIKMKLAGLRQRKSYVKFQR